MSWGPQKLAFWNSMVPLFQGNLGWCTIILFIFTPIVRKSFQFEEHIFQDGCFNHQPDELGRLSMPFPGNQARWGNEIFHVKGPAGLAIPWRRDPEAERSGPGGRDVTTSAT